MIEGVNEGVKASGLPRRRVAVALALAAMTWGPWAAAQAQGQANGPAQSKVQAQAQGQGQTQRPGQPGKPGPAAQLSRADPWEPMNRKVFAFNETVDLALVRPVAEGYQAVVPAPVRAGIDNFFGNFYDAWSVVNHLLQGKGTPAVEMTVRVATNSVLGLGGVIDLASEMGLERQSEDFGQTLGRWGVPSGPYVVLPLLGASTVRDASGRLVDRRASAANVAAQDDRSWAFALTEVVSTRAGLLGATRLLEQVALDKYTFVRDAYLARRRSEVYDGNPPEESDESPFVEPSR